MIRETEDFKRWIKGLRDRQAVGVINLRLRKLSLGHPGDAKPIGEGVSELRIDVGPGYRIYYASLSDGRIVLCGGDKSDQRRDVIRAKSLARQIEDWRERSPAMAVKTYPWDPSEHLDDDASIEAYLAAAFEDGDPKLIVAAIGDVARARGMSQIARETGLARESLYRALSDEGNPGFDTIVKVMASLNVKLALQKSASARPDDVSVDIEASLDAPS